MNPILLYLAFAGVLIGAMHVASEEVDKMDPFDVFPEEPTNTLCPRLGAAQWTCSKADCACHLKETIADVSHP